MDIDLAAKEAVRLSIEKAIRDFQQSLDECDELLELWQKDEDEGFGKTLALIGQINLRVCMSHTLFASHLKVAIDDASAYEKVRLYGRLRREENSAA